MKTLLINSQSLVSSQWDDDNNDNVISYIPNNKHDNGMMIINRFQYQYHYRVHYHDQEFSFPVSFFPFK